MVSRERQNLKEHAIHFILGEYTRSSVGIPYEQNFAHIHLLCQRNTVYFYVSAI